MRTPSFRIAFIVSLALHGCGLTSSDVDEPDLGSAEFEVATVPTGVRCIYVKAIGSTTMTKSFSVTAASTVTLALGRVPLGDVVFEGTAYDTACPNNTAAPSGQPSWVADSIAMEVFAGARIAVPFVFRKYGNGTGTVDFVDPVADITAGGQRTMAVMLDGTVREWGLGKTSVPAPVAGLTAVVRVVAGASHQCALRSDRTLWCWGSNTYGQLGDGTTTDRETPAPVPGLTDVVDASLGNRHSCAVTGSKQVYCWGDNSNLQLGDGTSSMRTTPVMPIPPYVGVRGMIKVAAGSWHTCTVTDQGQVFCWGQNLHGELGKGITSVASQPEPVDVSGLFAAVDVSAGSYNTCALRADGAVLCWGWNLNGEVGDGTSFGRASATQVQGLTNAVQVDVGGMHVCAVLADGSKRCWGGNREGQLGNGTGFVSPVPVVVGSSNDTAKVSAGGGHSCAVAQNGAATCWGDNTGGQLGDGTTTTRFVPVPVAF